MNNVQILKLTEGLGGEYLTKEIIKRSKDKNIIYLTEDVLLNTKCVQELAKYLENLIQRNKDLEQIEQEHKEENGRLRDRIKELEIEKENEFKRGFFTKVAENKANTLKIESQAIPIFKIEKKIEELNKEEKKVIKGTKGQDRYSIKLEYMHKRNALQELLEESEK